MYKNWLPLEYLGKGVALGLVGYMGFQALFAATSIQPWQGLAFFGLAGLGLVAALLSAAWRWLPQWQQVRGRFLPFLLMLLLENPVRLYAGILGGLLAGAVIATALAGWDWLYLLGAIASGAALGAAFFALERLENRWLRSGSVLTLIALIAFGLFFWLQSQTAGIDVERQDTFALYLLLAIPILYLLTLAGLAEETEVEIGAMCLALGLALAVLVAQHMPTAMLAAILVPLGIYVVYTQRVLKKLQVFKLVLRAMGFVHIGRYRDALLAYRRALQLDPNNRLARNGQWRVHRHLDIAQVSQDREILELVDLDLCQERARQLLLAPGPGPEQLDEADKLLSLVLSQEPHRWPEIGYWRAVLRTHARQYDEAASELRTVLTDPTDDQSRPFRDAVLLPAWRLALVQHAELKRRLGTAFLSEPGRRMAAITAVELRFKQRPDDPAAAELKPIVYDQLREAEYRDALSESDHGRVEVDYEYCLQRGRTRLSDPDRWREGVELLRVAAHGLPTRAPAIHLEIARAFEKAGETETARQHYGEMKRLARQVGVARLAPEDRQAYFTALRQLAERAQADSRWDDAIENLKLFTESPESGAGVLRQITELYERKRDPLSALEWNEKALMFDHRDKELLERKDRYYYSVRPDDLSARLQQVRELFDVGYCIRKARSLLDLKAGGPEQVDWALHLVELARVVEPENVTLLTLAARARLRRGEQDLAVPLLEKVRQADSSKFTSEDTESWYLASRLLGDLYLNALGRPDLAVACFNDYRQHPKSGVDTLYKMGQAFEQLGDTKRATKCYQNVVAYDHPLSYDAQLALNRLGASIP